MDSIYFNILKTMMVNEFNAKIQTWEVYYVTKNYICQGQVPYQKERVDTSLPMN